MDPLPVHGSWLKFLGGIALAVACCVVALILSHHPRSGLNKAGDEGSGAAPESTCQHRRFHQQPHLSALDVPIATVSATTGDYEDCQDGDGPGEAVCSRPAAISVSTSHPLPVVRPAVTSAGHQRRSAGKSNGGPAIVLRPEPPCMGSAERWEIIFLLFRSAHIFYDDDGAPRPAAARPLQIFLWRCSWRPRWEHSHVLWGPHLHNVQHAFLRDEDFSVEISSFVIGAVVKPAHATWPPCDGLCFLHFPNEDACYLTCMPCLGVQALRGTSRALHLSLQRRHKMQPMVLMTTVSTRQLLLGAGLTTLSPLGFLVRVFYTSGNDINSILRLSACFSFDGSTDPLLTDAMRGQSIQVHASMTLLHLPPTDRFVT